MDALARFFQRHGLLSSETCLRCDVCCRFPTADSPLVPWFGNREVVNALDAGLSTADFLPGEYGPGQHVRLVSHEAIYRCPGFRPERNDCRIYVQRPLDCRLYPFMLMYDAAGRSVRLGVDTYCPAMNDPAPGVCIEAAADELATLIDGSMWDAILACPGIVTSFKEHIRPLREMPRLTTALCRTDLGLARLLSTASPELEPLFQSDASRLSTHALPAVLLWSDTFNLYWTTSNDRLLILAEGDGDAFLFLPPVGEGDLVASAAAGIALLRDLAPGAASPRVQEIDSAGADILVAAGWRVTQQDSEYLYDRAVLAELHGNRLQKKRQMCNRFERDHKWRWRPFESDDMPAAVALYRHWLEHRTRSSGDVFVIAQAEASFRTFLRALAQAETLGLIARVLEADNRLAAVTVACALPDGRTFSDMFEIADPDIRGAAQFTFRRLCRELNAYVAVNAGPTSGLESLKRVKESYRPAARVPVLVAAPPD